MTEATQIKRRRGKRKKADAVVEPTTDLIRQLAHATAARNWQRWLARQPEFPLAWAAGDTAHRSTSLRLAARRLGAKRKKRQKPALAPTLASWLADHDQSLEREAMIECLAWSYLLPHVAEEAESALLEQLCMRLGQIAEEAHGIELTTDPVLHQLAAAELPYTLACLYPEVPQFAGLAHAGRRQLNRGPFELLDGDGLPHASNLPLVRPLLSCWTRCSQLARELETPLFADDAALQFEWFVRQAVRFSRRDGRQILSAHTGDWCDPLFSSALELCADDEDRVMASCTLPGKKRPKASVVDLASAEPVAHSQWAGLTVMRPTWNRPHEYFALTFAEQTMQIELSGQRAVLVSGPWDTQIHLDSRLLTPTSDWSELCWFTDDDIDYLELELEFGEWRLQRQLAFSRQDRLLLLADAVVGTRPARIAYQARLPLADAVEVQACDETPELILQSEKARTVVIPLALPEWKTAKAYGRLATNGHSLQLTHQGQGAALYAPLLIDPVARRAKKDRTWRQLTVAEQLEIQPPEVAVGYRAQIGRQQWLIYRALRNKASRTVLGQNLVTEFLFGQFDAEGEVDPLIEIE